MAATGLCATERRKPGAGSRRDPKSRVRLTRRGRIVVTAAAAVLVTGAMAVASLQVGAGTAQATSNAIPRHAAEQNLRQLIVLPGQSLWSVAEAADPDADTRIVVQQIIDLNALTGTVVQPGERLWVPRG